MSLRLSFLIFWTIFTFIALNVALAQTAPPNSTLMSTKVFEDITTSFPIQFTENVSAAGWNCQIDETHLRLKTARDVFFYETSCSFRSEVQTLLNEEGYELVKVVKNDWSDLEERGITETRALFERLVQNSFEEDGQLLKDENLDSIVGKYNITSSCLFSPIRIERDGKKRILNADGVECTMDIRDPGSGRVLFGFTAALRNVKCVGCEDETIFMALEKLEFKSH